MTVKDVAMDDPATGRFAIYREPVDSGDFDDPNSAPNAPLNSPLSYLRYLYFHSDLRHLAVAAAGSATISHVSAGGGSNIPLADNASKSTNFEFGTYSADHDLVNHGLGYDPFAIVAVGDNVCWPGVPVQFELGNGFRTATPFVTSTMLRLNEIVSSASALAATSITYAYLVLKAPVGPQNAYLRDWNPTTGVQQFGYGKWRSDERWVQVVPGGSPLALFQDRSIDAANGAIRAIRADGTFYEPVPSGAQLGFVRLGQTPAFAGSMAYDGSYTGPTPIQIQAP